MSTKAGAEAGRRRPDRRRPDLDTVYTINADGSRNFLHPADVRGPWQLRKNVVWLLLMVIYLGLPFVRIGGHPAVNVDIAKRSAHLFGATFTNQDFHLFFFLLLGFGLTLFVVTSLWGRIWCGFACPQTVFMEGVFRRLERWIEGERVRRIAAFPLRVELSMGLYPAFADCSVRARPSAYLMGFVSRIYGLGLADWETHLGPSAGGSLFESMIASFPNAASEAAPAKTAATGLAERNWFAQAGSQAGCILSVVAVLTPQSLFGGFLLKIDRQKQVIRFLRIVGAVQVSQQAVNMPVQCTHGRAKFRAGNVFADRHRICQGFTRKCIQLQLIKKFLPQPQVLIQVECGRNADGQAGFAFRLRFKRHRLFSFPEQVESATVIADVVGGIIVSAAQKTVGDPLPTNISQG